VVRRLVLERASSVRGCERGECSLDTRLVAEIENGDLGWSIGIICIYYRLK
jgi:hypothetical protein